MNYDLVVIGSGPGGEKAAIQAAKLGKNVAVVEQDDAPGGNCLHRGTIPSKTLREAVLYISMVRQKAVYGVSTRLDDDLTLNRLMTRKRSAVMSLADRLETNFERNGVELIKGAASFVSPHEISINSSLEPEKLLETSHAVIATGSRPFHPEWIDFDNPRVRDSDTILDLEKIPRTITIIGAGVIGCEYATMFSNLGCKVNLVNPRRVLLDFLDLEISNALSFLMRDQGIRIRLGETLNAVNCEEDCVYALTDSGKSFKSDVLLFANGRSGNTKNLGLERIDIPVNSRGNVEVNSFLQTAHENIYAVGDVIGFPALAATAMDQGRFATLHAFGENREKHEFKRLPTGIYTIPEISTIGATEEELTQEKVPYEVGSSSYKEIARGQIVGNTIGRCKLLFHRETLKLLGVHILGDRATDLIAIGQTVMAFNGTIEYFIEHTFNYPTYSECYRIAALNGVNRL